MNPKLLSASTAGASITHFLAGHYFSLLPGEKTYRRSATGCFAGKEGKLLFNWMDGTCGQTQEQELSVP